MGILIPEDVGNEYYAKIDGIEFRCNEDSEINESLIKDLSKKYDKITKKIAEFLQEDISNMYQIEDIDEIESRLGLPVINIDNNTITYANNNFENNEAIILEYTGIFDEFYRISLI